MGPSSKKAPALIEIIIIHLSFIEIIGFQKPARDLVFVRRVVRSDTFLAPIRPYDVYLKRVGVRPKPRVHPGLSSPKGRVFFRIKMVFFLVHFGPVLSKYAKRVILPGVPAK